MDGFLTRAEHARGKRAIRAWAVLPAAWAATVAGVPRVAIAADDDSTAASGPQFYNAKPGSLLKARQRIAAGDMSLAPYFWPDSTKPDGSQPHELKRTKSLSYWRFNLETIVEKYPDALADRFQLLFVP